MFSSCRDTVDIDNNSN